jgi:hypothetical protein
LRCAVFELCEPATQLRATHGAPRQFRFSYHGDVASSASEIKSELPWHAAWSDSLFGQPCRDPPLESVGLRCYVRASLRW